MNALKAIRKTVQTGLKSVTWTAGNWVDYDTPGNISSHYVTGPYPQVKGSHIPGQHLNYAALVGPLHHNSAYMACITSILDAFPEAPPCIKEKDPKGVLTVNPDHELADLVENLGHADYDSSVMWAMTLIDYFGPGDGYWLPVYDQTGMPRELRFVPQWSIRPVFPAVPTANTRPIERFVYVVGNIQYDIPVEEIIHFQYGADPLCPALGLGRGLSLLREIFTDNEATNYTGSILRNMGMFGRVFMPKDAESAKQFDEKVIIDTVKSQTTGEKRGASIAFNRPLDIYEPKNTPEQMAIDKIRKYPESRVCAVMGVPALVAGLLTGSETKTYSNYEEARRALWEDLLLPTMRALASQATQQLIRRIPKYSKPKTYFGFDDRQVRAIQVDTFKRNLDAREMFRFRVWDRARVLTAIGDEPKPEDIGLYYDDPGVTGPEPATPREKPGVDATSEKSFGMPEEDDPDRRLTWEERILAEIDSCDEPRAVLNGKH